MELVEVGNAPERDLGPDAVDPPEAGVVTGLVATGSMQVAVLDASGRRVLVQEPMATTQVFQFETLPLVGSAAQRELLGRRHFTTAEGGWSAKSSV